MGYPIDIAKLPLTKDTKNLLIGLMERFDNCLDWDNPGTGVIWTDEENLNFRNDALSALYRARDEIGHDFVIVDEI